MSVIDYQYLMGEDQAFTTQAAHASTNIIDVSGGLGKDAWGTAKANNPGAAHAPAIWLNVKVTTAVTSAGSPTVTTTLQECASASTWTSATTLLTSAAHVKGTLVAGYDIFKQPLPKISKRYLRVVYTVATADLTAGKFSAWIGLDPAQGS